MICAYPEHCECGRDTCPVGRCGCTDCREERDIKDQWFYEDMKDFGFESFALVLAMVELQ